jgi:hypothetical protein
LYRNGLGVKRDDVIAYVLWSLAVNAGIFAPTADIEVLDETMTTKQREEAHQIISSWKPGTRLPLRSQTWK